jgi:hypothetical protein
MTIRKIRITCLVLLPALLAIATPVFAQEAHLTDIIVTNTRDDLLLYLTVEGAFRDKMKKAILSGVPATFSFFITLHRVRNWWTDKEFADLKISHTIKYDNLKKEFIVKRSWENDKPYVTRSFGEAQKYLAEIDGLKVVSLSKLQKGSRYQLMAKAELEKVTLPLYLHYVLFFMSLWDFETDWYTIDFIY